MFSPERFVRLARAHFTEHLRGYGWFLAGVLLIGIVVSTLFAVSDAGFRDYDWRAQESMYYTGLFLFSIIFAGRYFQAMSQRAPALLALMRPASSFEKWLLAALVVAVLFPLAYSVLFYLVDIPNHFIAHVQAQDFAAKLAQDYARNPIGDRPLAFDPHDYRLFLPWRELEGWGEFANLALLLLALQGFAMFGSLYFRSVPFIKTLLAGLLFLLLASLFASAFDGDPDLVMEIWDADRPMSTMQVWGYTALWFAVPALLWLACFLSIREREISA